MSCESPQLLAQGGACALLSCDALLLVRRLLWNAVSLPPPR
jgi:hypothetical protein